MIERENKLVYVNNEDIGRFNVIVNDCEARLYNRDGLDRVIEFESMTEDYDGIFIYTKNTKNYYKPHDIEAWDIIPIVLQFYGEDLTNVECFYIGNILKYLLRFKYKGQKEEDLEKIKTYIDKL